MAFSFLKFLDHTQRRTTVGRTPLDEWSSRRRELYLTTQNTHNRQTSMPPVGLEPMISAGERLQTYALDRAATGTGGCISYMPLIVTVNMIAECLRTECNSLGYKKTVTLLILSTRAHETQTQAHACILVCRSVSTSNWELFHRSSQNLVWLLAIWERPSHRHILFLKISNNKAYAQISEVRVTITILVLGF
jgi:hypothetical protein